MAISFGWTFCSDDRFHHHPDRRGFRKRNQYLSQHTLVDLGCVPKNAEISVELYLVEQQVQRSGLRSVLQRTSPDQLLCVALMKEFRPTPRHVLLGKTLDGCH